MADLEPLVQPFTADTRGHDAGVQRVKRNLQDVEDRTNRLRVALGTPFEGLDRAGQRAATQLNTLRSTLGGAERAAAQYERAEWRLNTAIKAGLVSETEAARLRRLMGETFSTAAVKARDLRTNIAGLRQEMGGLRGIAEHVARALGAVGAVRLGGGGGAAGGLVQGVGLGAGIGVARGTLTRLAALPVGVGVGAAAGLGAVGLGAAAASAGLPLALAGERIQLQEAQLKALGSTGARPELVQLGFETGDVDAAVQAFTRLSIARDNLGVTTSELVDFERDLLDAIRISGTGTQQASAGLFQFTQALTSAGLQGDEFRSVLENIPFVAKAISAGLVEMGVAATGSVGELRELSRAGELTPKRLYQAFRIGFAQIASDAEDVPRPMLTAFGTIVDSARETGGRIANALGLTSFFRNVGKVLQEEVPKWDEQLASFVERWASRPSVQIPFEIRLEQVAANAKLESLGERIDELRERLAEETAGPTFFERLFGTAEKQVRGVHVPPIKITADLTELRAELAKLEADYAEVATSVGEPPIRSAPALSIAPQLEALKAATESAKEFQRALRGLAPTLYESSTIRDMRQEFENLTENVIPALQRKLGQPVRMPIELVLDQTGLDALNAIIAELDSIKIDLPDFTKLGLPEAPGVPVLPTSLQGPESGAIVPVSLEQARLEQARLEAGRELARIDEERAAAAATALAEQKAIADRINEFAARPFGGEVPVPAERPIPVVSTRQTGAGAVVTTPRSEASINQAIEDLGRIDEITRRITTELGQTPVAEFRAKVVGLQEALDEAAARPETELVKFAKAVEETSTKILRQVEATPEPSKAQLEAIKPLSAELGGLTAKVAGEKAPVSQFRELTATIQEVDAAAINAGRSMQDAMIGFALEGENAIDVLNRLGLQLAEIALRTATTGLFERAIPGLIGPLFGGSAAAAGAAGASTQTTSVLSASSIKSYDIKQAGILTGTITPSQFGGPAHRDELLLVGERRPEQFVQGTGGGAGLGGGLAPQMSPQIMAALTLPPRPIGASGGSEIVGAHGPELVRATRPGIILPEVDEDFAYRALGGPLTRHQAALVGEDRPERFAALNQAGASVAGVAGIATATAHADRLAPAIVQAGAPGAAGVAGLATAIGQAGQSGIPGLPGSAGLPGAPGIAGAAGGPGAPGIATAIGLAGAAGGPGVPGSAGLPGAPGAAGGAGRPSTATAIGQAGASGLPGPTGLAGAAGASSLTSTIGQAGLPGIATAPAIGAGLPGAPGLPGAAGPAIGQASAHNVPPQILAALAKPPRPIGASGRPEVLGAHGPELVQATRSGIVLPQIDPRIAFRALGGPLAGQQRAIVGEGLRPEMFIAGPPSVSSGQGGGGNGDVSIKVVDMRSGNPPEIQPSVRTGPGGQRMIEIMVADGVTSAAQTGRLDAVMGRFGGRRTGIVRS